MDGKCCRVRNASFGSGFHRTDISVDIFINLICNKRPARGLRHPIRVRDKYLVHVHGHVSECIAGGLACGLGWRVSVVTG